MNERRRLDLRRPTDVPTTRIRPITMAEIAADYEAERARARAAEQGGGR